MADINTIDGAAQSSELKPSWIRPKDVQKYFGIGRTALYAILAENKIRNVSMRKRGQRHGTRLINYQSLHDYLESLAKGG
jgi:hypothetical protein